MSVVIKAENISKQYRLGLVGTGTVRDDLKRWYYNVRGKENPFLKIGEANDRSFRGDSDYVWSLRDINFDIHQGDSVGIIGRNGAGKSTLLKILSQVTRPTTGKIYTKGRIASLLEVGTGFHPEMTGRENIFLNGSILGMRKKEIARKFDEIVDFSGVERYIDTPVKRYSSGMYVRLAFAVAAHLESEILIVDEVLAVGDAEFQKKCLGKMNDVSKGDGRTVLFVSHNIGAIKQLCDKGIYLQNGNLSSVGNIDDVIEKYVGVKDTVVTFKNESKNLSLENFRIICNEISITEIPHDGDFVLKITINSAIEVKGVIVALLLMDKYENKIATIHVKPVDIKLGINNFNVEVKGSRLTPGYFKWKMNIHNDYESFLVVEELHPFKIFDNGSAFYKWADRDYGKIFLDYKIF